LALHLSEDLRGRHHRVLAASARRRPRAAGHALADRDRGCDLGGRQQAPAAGEILVILLETVDLSKQFGDLRACDSVNFTVHTGALLSLVASNSAGKTSLVNLTSGPLPPTRGPTLVEGNAVPFATVYERIRAGIALSFQIVYLFAGLSVFDNVALSIFSREGKIARIAALADHDQDVRRETFDVLGRFGLNGKSGVPAGGLAQGER